MQVRQYDDSILFGPDYYKIRGFLIKLGNINYPFGRWDWMITHGYLDKSGLGKIGIWEDGGEVAALATYDCGLGKAFLLALPKYEYLKRDMLHYARENLSKDGKFMVIINDADADFQEICASEGYIPTQEKDCDAVYPIEIAKIKYNLPEGFRVTSLADDYDLYKYGECLWKGFNHESEGPFAPSEEDMRDYEMSMNRVNVNLDLKIAVVSPEGDFVSYCGMWQDSASPYALVEPVATAPKYRRMGLGRAAVLEAVRRCGELGAKAASVGSSQQFYYSIGFRPRLTSTFWAPAGALVP